MSGHIVNDFKDLRKLIGQVTKDQPAKTQYQQQAEKMGYRLEAEAQPKDDKGDRGIARTLKKHAGEDDIKKAYMKLGRSAQGSVEYQRKLLQKQLSKMGFKTYSKFAFDNLFKFESNQMIAKWLINEVQLESALSDMQNIVKTKGARKINGIMVDMFTASVITRAYDKVSDANKKKMEKANLQTLVKLAHKIMGMNEELELDEWNDPKLKKYSNLIKKKRELEKKGQNTSKIDKEIEKEKNKLSKTGVKFDEGKYLKYSDLLLKKSRLIDKSGPNSPAIKAINKEIEKEMRKLGIHQMDIAMGEDIQEGTWAVPDTKDKMKALNNLMKKPLIIKLLKDAKKATNTLGKIIGDDTVHDQFYDMADSYRDGAGAMDARDAVVNFLEDWGYTVKNYQITHYPIEYDVTGEDVQEKGNLKKPKKGKLLKLDNKLSRSQQVKEDYEHAKQSPFKLKSQRYPRAIAINTDGFGKRHATVEDIISACDSFGMILDKELQVEQVQKQLGKVGFISYKKSELEDVFEERETQRIILALESVSEEQESIGYTKNEITEAYIMGEEIEFLKPDGLKTAGPVLKKGGNTYNVKDKFTGKSYTYKYIGETEVKTFKEVVNEGRFPKQLIKQAGGIAFDKRYYQGNMSGAIKAIEKLKKGLSDDPKVREMLKIANEGVSEGKMGNLLLDIQQGATAKELAKDYGISLSAAKNFLKDYYGMKKGGRKESVDEWTSKDGTRRRVKERDQRKYKKVQEWEDAVEASGDKEAYQKFFNKAMKKFGISSPDELEGDKKKEFFDYVDKNWKGDHEEVEQDVHKSYKVDGRRKNFREKMKKLGYIKGR